MSFLNNLPSEVRKVAELCSAPICVVYLHHTSTNAGNMGTNYNDGAIWYPEEAICSCYRKSAVKNYLNTHDGSAPKWIKRQHNIKKHNIKKGIKQADGYFTYEMLNANRIVKGSTRGVNPDYDESIQINRFFNTNTKNIGVNDGE